MYKNSVLRQAETCNEAKRQEHSHTYWTHVCTALIIFSRIVMQQQ